MPLKYKGYSDFFFDNIQRQDFNGSRYRSQHERMIEKMSNEQQFSCFIEIRKNGLRVHISKSDILARDLIYVIRMRFMALCLFRRIEL